MAMGMGGGGGMGRVMLGGGMGAGMGHDGRRRGVAGEKPPMPDKAVVKRVGRLFGPYKKDVSIVGVTILIASGLGALSPLLIKPVFDKGLFPPGGPNMTLLCWLVAAMIAIAVVSSVLGVYQSYLTNVVGQRVMRDLRANLYQHLQSLSLRFFTSTKTGE